MDLRPNILVGCPVHRREWVLPTWYEHVLLAARVAKVEPTFVVAMEEADQAGPFCRERQFDIVTTWEPAQNRSRRNWGKERYQHMVTIRNQLLGRVRELAPDYFLSLDSDILLHPDQLKNLLESASLYDAVGGRTYMTIAGTHVPSNGTVLPGYGLMREDSHHVIPMQIIMGIKLMSPAAYNVDYRCHDYGEDIGWSLACERQGLKLGYDGRVAAKHVFEPRKIEEYDKRCGF